MMNKQALTTLAAAFLIAGLVGTANAALIDGSGITVTASSFNTGGAGFPPIQTIDESGLNTGTGVHNTSPGTSWLTPNFNDVSAEWIQWDLGDSYILDSVHVWNANQNTDFSTEDVAFTTPVSFLWETRKVLARPTGPSSVAQP